MFQDMKILMLETLGLSRDAMHIYVGLGVFLFSALIFRWSLAQWRPLAMALLAALIGEAWDIYDTQILGARQQFAGNWHDLWNTMFWPLMIFLAARYTPLFRR
jgi:hypothetical protein